MVVGTAVEEKITIRIFKKDHDFLHRLKQKHRLAGLDGVVEALIKIVKVHKMEEELR